MTTKKPKSGYWTPIDTAFVAGAFTPVRRGERYAWDDPVVQAAPGLFVSAELPPDEVSRAATAYRNSSLDETAAMAATMDRTTSSGIRVHIPGPLVPGVGVVRCVRSMTSTLPSPLAGGPSLIRVRRGDLAIASAWYVRRWPSHFEPSIT